MSKEEPSVEELRKEIVLARLRETPGSVKISFGNSKEGKFLSAGDLINEVKKDTSIGKNVVKIQFEYLKALKEGFLEH